MITKKLSPAWKLLGVILLVSLSGCAAAYHDYQGCCIPYLYCPLRPLPVVVYGGCHCPTPTESDVAQNRLNAVDDSARLPKNCPAGRAGTL